MLGRSREDLSYVRPLRIRRPDGIVPICQRNCSIQSKINDRLRLTRKAVYMTRRMIVPIDDKAHAAKPY